MSTGKPRDLQKEQQWRRWVRDWQRSGAVMEVQSAITFAAPG